MGLKMRVRYNSPVILTFSLAAVAVYLLGLAVPSSQALFALAPGFSFLVMVYCLPCAYPH